MNQSTAEETDFVKAYRAMQADKKPHEFDISEWFKMPAGSGKVAIVTATKNQQDRAIAGAQEYAKKLANGDERTANDPDILDDAKSAFIAHVVCRDPKQPDKMPLFLSPGVMMETLTSEQIAVLVNLANEVRTKEGPAPKSINDETVEALAIACADHAGDDIPEAILANLGREYLTHLVVLLAIKLRDARKPFEPADHLNTEAEPEESPDAG